MKIKKVEPNYQTIKEVKIFITFSLQNPDNFPDK